MLAVVGCGTSESETYSVYAEDGTTRIVTKEEALQEIRSGRIGESTLVYIGGEWKRFDAQPATSALLQEARAATSPPPAAAPSVSAAPETRNTRGRARRGQRGSQGPPVPVWRIGLFFLMLGAGGLMACGGGIWLLVIAFRESLGWGFACLVFSPIFIFTHLGESWRPVALNILGLVFCGLSLFVLV